LVILGACGGNTEPPPAATSTNFADILRTALETASEGDVIDIPAGTFEFKRSLTLNTDGVTMSRRSPTE
ncbi:MAG: hypothetical protein GXP16_20185, partial [Gammaproteobacteria bacterium]|nr:hypothetical protein [Gammaproteobacteria bacterium]